MESIQSIYKSVNQKLKELKTIIHQDFMVGVGQVNSWRKLIEEVKINPHRKESLMVYFSSIIQDLQFHDIIVQQLDHIININEIIFALEVKEEKEAFIHRFCVVQVTLLENILWQYGNAKEGIDIMLQGIVEEPHIEINASEGLAKLFPLEKDFSALIEQVLIELRTIDIKGLDVNLENEEQNILEIRKIFSMQKERRVFDQYYHIEFMEDDITDVELF